MSPATIGQPEMIALWKDPAFDPEASAAYYGRVIEIPTPRCTAYDLKRLNTDIPEGVEIITQERAYT